MELMGKMVLYLGHIGYLATFEQVKTYIQRGQLSRYLLGIDRDKQLSVWP